MNDCFGVVAEKNTMMRYLLYGIVVFLGFNITASDGAMKKNSEFCWELRRNQCEKKFGISKVKLADDNQGVVADWSNPSEWPIFKATDWHIDNAPTTYETQSGGVLRKWAHKKNEEIIIIELIVSSTGSRAALDCLIENASATTMVEVPYSKAEGLGDLYVNSLHPNSRALIWMYRNICFQINHDFKGIQNPSIDTFALAKWIQQYAEKHLVNNISDYYPQISRFDISQRKIYVGDTFSITLTPSSPKEVENCLMEWNLNKNSLSYSNEEGFSLHVKALKQGPADVTFTLVDLNNLLSTRKTVTINVLERGKE